MVYKSVRICPASGPGSLNKFELKRRVKEIVAEFDANSEMTCKQAEAVNLGTTFKEQAERWLQTVQTRKRNPIKPRTADAWTGYLKYINQQIGELPLSEVNNLSVKQFVAKMSAEEKKGKPRFAPKSVTHYAQPRGKFGRCTVFWQAPGFVSKRLSASKCKMSRVRFYTSSTVIEMEIYTIRRLPRESVLLTFTLRWLHCSESILASANRVSCFSLRVEHRFRDPMSCGEASTKSWRKWAWRNPGFMASGDFASGI